MVELDVETLKEFPKEVVDSLEALGLPAGVYLTGGGWPMADGSRILFGIGSFSWDGSPPLNLDGKLVRVRKRP